MAEAEADVSRIEQTVADIEARIAAGECSDGIFKEHADTQKQLENAMSIWELAVMDLEQAGNR